MKHSLESRLNWLKGKAGYTTDALQLQSVYGTAQINLLGLSHPMTQSCGPHLFKSPSKRLRSGTAWHESKVRSRAAEPERAFGLPANTADEEARRILRMRERSNVGCRWTTWNQRSCFLEKVRSEERSRKNLLQSVNRVHCYMLYICANKSQVEYSAFPRCLHRPNQRVFTEPEPA